MKEGRKFFSIRSRILVLVIISFLLISFSISLISYIRTRAFLEENIYSHISSLLSMTKRWLKDSFSSEVKDLLFLAENPTTHEVLFNIKMLFESVDDQKVFFNEIRDILLNKKQSKEVIFDNYMVFFNKLSNFIKKYENITKGYKNIILVDANSGYIYFESTLKPDFGATLSIYKGKYKSSPLAYAFYKALKLKKGEVLFHDFTFYPSYGQEPVAFLATPIYDVTGELNSVCIAVLSVSTLRKVFPEVEKEFLGLRVYVVGEDHLLRMGTGIKEEEILRKKFEGEIVNKALSGEKGRKLQKDKSGNKIVVYEPIDVFDKKWAIIGEVPESMAFLNANRLRNEIFIISIVLAVLFSIFIYFHIFEVMEPIKKLTDFVIKIVKKELPLDTDIKMRTGNEIEILSEHFNSLIHILKEEVDTIAKLINMIDREAMNLENIAEKEKWLIDSQASSVTELAVSVEEFSKTMKNITEVNERALKEFEVLKGNAMEKRGIQGKAREGMKNLKEEMEKLFKLFDDIVTMNKDIRGISDIIDNIADQIKIIAFNASLEAARAGEEGRGFSIIAAQIRELLENISKQNVEIKKLIDENSKNIEMISEGSEKITYFLNTEEENVRMINEFIEDVLNLIEKNEEFISSISISQRQQKVAVEEFSASINEVKEKLEDGKALIDDILESVAVLREIIDELNQTKDRIR